MKRTIFNITLILGLILVASVFVVATPAFNVPNSVIPENAVELSHGVFSLGEATDVNGRVVQGYLFIHDGATNQRKENAKPSWAGGGKNTGSSSTCYSLMAKGARWKTTENYLVDYGVDSSLMETSVDTWDSEVSFNIFGNGLVGPTNGADDVSPDGRNEVMSENLGATNTIAYTIVWGIFYGSPRNRELVEWDMVFNSAYVFGNADTDPNVMDFQNIATHELGHALGLTHPESTCTEETMYAYASYGETKKRTLEAGDLAGLNNLY